jgi:MFS transporter, DHA2 family, glioxin efflux transporter
MSSNMATLTPSLSSSATDLSKSHIPITDNDEKRQDVELGSAVDSSVHDKEAEENGEPLGQQLSQVDTSDYPTKIPLVMIVVALCLAVFMMALDMTIVATAIPKITDEFHSLDQVGWYGSAFFLTVAAFQSTWGKAFKYFPLKTSFLLSMFIFELGSLICAVANGSTMLIIGRAIAGAGGAGLSSGAYTIIAFSAPPRQRPAFTGVLGAVFGVASVIGPLLGGVFTDDLSWRWCFYINLPVGGLAAAMVFFFFTPPKASKPVQATLKEKLLQMDLPGTFTIMAATVCYLLAMQWGGSTKPWSDGSVIGTLVAFGVLVIVFVAIEWYSGNRALLQFRLLKDRTIAASVGYIFIISGSFFILLYYLPIYFQATKHVSASRSGIDNLPLVFGASIFSVVSGVLITITGHYVPLMVFGSVVSSVGCGLVYTLDITSGSGKWIGYQALCGIGLGLVFQIPVIVNQSVVKVSDLATISAMTLFFQTIGGAFMISAAQAGFTNKLIERLPFTAPGADKTLVLMTGASELRNTFHGEQLAGVLAAYMDGLKVPFALAIACAATSTLVAFGPKWQTIKVRM